MLNYHHYFYETNIDIEGEYFTIEELLDLPKVKEYNLDIITYIKEYYNKEKENRNMDEKDKKCNCKETCTCGCQEGEKCTCEDKECNCNCGEPCECDEENCTCGCHNENNED